MASEISEREKVYELFERAVKDYICKSFKNALKWVVLHPDLAFFVVFIGKSLPSVTMQKLSQNFKLFSKI